MEELARLAWAALLWIWWVGGLARRPHLSTPNVIVLPSETTCDVLCVYMYGWMYVCICRCVCMVCVCVDGACVLLCLLIEDN